MNDVPLVAHIALNSQRLSTVLLYFSDNLLGGNFMIEIVDRDRVPADCQQLRYGCSDATAGARDDGNRTIVGRHFPLKSAFRFSRNAVVPSFLSSEEQETANNTASRYRPSASVISMPLFTASMAYRSEE